MSLTALQSQAVGDIKLAWNLSTGAHVAGYNIYYGTTSRAYTSMVSAGNATQLTIPGLVEGLTYYFAATTFDSFGIESDYSAEISGSINTQNQSPAGYITLVWNRSASPGTVGYNVYYGAASRIYTNKLSAGNATQITIPRLVNGITYYLAATALDSFGIESDYSAEISSAITLQNQPPTLASLANLTINENDALRTVNLSGISSGAANENQTLTVTATSSNPGLIPNPTVNYTSPDATGSISFSPVKFQFGSALITVTVNDGVASISRSFTVTVKSVNQRPTLRALGNLTINENAALRTINLSGISSGATNENQTLTVTATSSNRELIPDPSVNYTSPDAIGSIVFSPVKFQFGSAVITVTVNDGGASNNVFSRSFTVTVKSVNQRPTLRALANRTINENAGTQTVKLSGISSGATNEDQTLTVTATSSNPELIPDPTVNYTSPDATGSISFSPVDFQSGSALITVTVDDGGASNNVISRSFTVTVNASSNVSGNDGTNTASRAFLLQVQPGTPTQPVLQPPVISDGLVTLTWSALPGRSYQVEYCSDLSLNAWTLLGDPVTATDAVISAAHSIKPGPQGFYRVSLIPSIALGQSLPINNH